MEKWETYPPQQAGEEVKSETAHTSAEVSSTPEAKETALNPRIRALQEARDEAERKLQEAILDLETREQSPAFQKASDLFNSGFRIKCASGYTDRDYAIYDYTVAGEKEPKRCTVIANNRVESEEGVESYSNGVTIRTGNVLNDLNIQGRRDEWQIIHYLLDLTSEATHDSLATS